MLILTEVNKQPTSLHIQAFATWLIGAGEHERLTKKHLCVLYGEFLLFTDHTPLTEGCLFRGFAQAGIVRYREGTGARRWLYRVTPPSSAVARLPLGKWLSTKSRG